MEDQPERTIDKRNRPQGELDVIFHARTQGEAHSLVIFLAGRDIAAIVRNENMATSPAGFFEPVLYLLFGLTGSSPYALAPEVLVSRDDKERAEAALLEFQRMTLSEPDADIVEKEEPERNNLSWLEWPRCPQCSSKRIVECPDCGEAGDDFPLSEYQEEEAPLEPTRGPASETNGWESLGRYPILICPQCSAAFRPEFYRQCAPCGHAFADGRDPPPKERRSRLPWAYVFATVAVVLAVVILWWMMERRHFWNEPLPELQQEMQRSMRS